MSSGRPCGDLMRETLCLSEPQAKLHDDRRPRARSALGTLHFVANELQPVDKESGMIYCS